eukprot:scaffold2858_cov51-Attheya_sp.AAC.1
MILIDEISFCKANELEQLDRALKCLKEEAQTYGGLHVIFCGDFHQLPPVGAPSIWEENQLLWHNVLNSFVELEGTWRFAEDPEWGAILGRIHLEIPTTANYACHSNKERNYIHAGVFAKHLDTTHHKNLQFDPPKHTIIIKADLAWTSTGNPVRPGMAKIIYESCGDHFCNYNQNKKHDPYLCLYNGCELMLGNNINVSKGEANGTRGIFKGIRLKVGENIHVTCLNSYYVNSVYASQVESVQCEHTGSKYTGSFIVEPKKSSV